MEYTAAYIKRRQTKHNHVDNAYTACTDHKHDMPMQASITSYNTSLLVDTWLVTWTLEFTGSKPLDSATQSENAEGPIKHQSLHAESLFQGSAR